MTSKPCPFWHADTLTCGKPGGCTYTPAAERGAGMANEPKNPDGFTPQLEGICRNRCAEFGDPPCWTLPELVQPCEQITPCAECIADVALTLSAASEDAPVGSTPPQGG